MYASYRLTQPDKGVELPLEKSEIDLIISEAVVLDKRAEFHVSEDLGRLESDLDTSLTCSWQRCNSEQMSSYRQTF
jgi:hypothetical protein